MKPTKQQSIVSGFLIFLLIIGAYAVGFIGWGSPKQTSVPTDNDAHGHVPNSFPGIALPTWSPDPFTTSSVTFVILPGLTQNLQARTAVQGLQVLLLGNIFCKISAGASAEINVFIDGTDQGLGVRVLNTAFAEVTIFLAAPNVFNDIATHTFDLRVEVNSALATFSAQDIEPLDNSVVSYFSAVDLGTGLPIVP